MRYVAVHAGDMDVSGGEGMRFWRDADLPSRWFVAASAGDQGTERDALEFARRACEYLRPKGVEAVEAWSVQIQNEKLGNEKWEGPGLVRFCLRPHANGRDWVAEPNELHHGGWWGDLEQAVDYALFRGSGRVCAVEIKNARLEVGRVVLVDRTGQDACPTQGRRVT